MLCCVQKATFRTEASAHHVHAEEDGELLELMPVLLQAVEAVDHGLWGHLRSGVHACCSSCLHCIVGFHDVAEQLELRNCAAMAETLAVDAAERLQQSLLQACCEMESADAGSDRLSMKGVLALLEVLAFWNLLGDVGICSYNFGLRPC